MKKVYRVSRCGLTRCPECARHIFLAENWTETDCSFCDAHLVAHAPPVQPPALQRVRSTRSGLIAAGLMSLSIGAAACTQDDDGKTDAGMMAVDAEMTSDASAQTDGMMIESDAALPQPLYGAVALDASPEPEPQPEYGAPPLEDMGVEIDMAPEPEPQPEYGAPPVSEDAGVEIDAAPDPGPQPEYGAPPEGDTEP